MSKYKYSPIVLTGPSGSGKSVLIDYIEKHDPLFLEATGSTTRKKRDNEIGKMYFISKDEFKKLILSNQLIEYCIYKDNYYGVSKEEFKKLNDNYMIFNVGYLSGKVIKSLYDDSFMIFLLPSSKEELLRRIGNRGMERCRLGMEETLQNALKYDFLLISLTNDLENTFCDFMDIINNNSKSKQKRLILAKNRDFINNFYK